jgi:Zn-dependent alcohol dehydrogenase
MPIMIPEKQISTTAFVVEKPGAPFVLQDVILDEVRANEVLVEMKYTGLCHTVCVIHSAMDFPKETNIPSGYRRPTGRNPRR